MSERLKRVAKDGTERDYGEIMHTEQVAHVTFYITEGVGFYDGDDLIHEYDIYSESEKLGIHPIDGFEYQQHNSGSYDDALAILRMEIQKLEEILEHKRDGIPTQRQLFFLFRNKIPIPLTLTWGEASDLIDEKLAQIAKDRQVKRLERFNGFTEGDRVSYFSSWYKRLQLVC